MNQMADKDDDLYEAVSAMADRIGLKGGEKQKYVHDHMTRGGYKAVPQYVPADDADDDDDDDDKPFFRRQRGRRDSSRDRSRRRSRDDDDWYDS
jgi:hypothetical protein